MAAARTPVCYFVPEDGDEEEHPNYFTIGRAANKVRLGDVKKTFPLPGAYHFRFKRAFKNTFVWLDVLDDFEVVPRYEGLIVAKVSRLRAPKGAESGFASSGAVSSTARAAGAGATAGAVHGFDAARSAPQLGSQSADDKFGSGDLLGLGSPPQSGAGDSSSASSSSSSSSSARLAAPAGAGVAVVGGAPSSSLHSISADFGAVNLGGPANGVAAPMNGSASAVSSGMASSKMMDLDWSSVPSPSPSPPPSAALGSGTPLRSSTPVSLNQARSSSPVRKAQPAKQRVQIPDDLSSAAKDFKL